VQRHRRRDDVSLEIWSKAEQIERRHHPTRLDVDAQQHATAIGAHPHGARIGNWRAVFHDTLAEFAPAQFEDQSAESIRRRVDQAGVHPAFEAITRVACDVVPS